MDYGDDFMHMGIVYEGAIVCDIEGGYAEALKELHMEAHGKTPDLMYGHEWLVFPQANHSCRMPVKVFLVVLIATVINMPLFFVFPAEPRESAPLIIMYMMATLVLLGRYFYWRGLTANAADLLHRI